MMFSAIIFGLFGSILGDLLLLSKIGKMSRMDRPDFKDFVFYLPIATNLILGFGFVLAYYLTYNGLGPLIAIHIGASSPILARTIKKAIPL